MAVEEDNAIRYAASYPILRRRLQSATEQDPSRDELVQVIGQDADVLVTSDHLLTRE